MLLDDVEHDACELLSGVEEDLVLRDERKRDDRLRGVTKGMSRALRGASGNGAQRLDRGGGVDGGWW